MKKKKGTGGEASRTIYVFWTLYRESRKIARRWRIKMKRETLMAKLLRADSQHETNL